jgi:hypothetical protein
MNTISDAGGDVVLLLDVGVTGKRNDKAPPLAITGSIPFDDWFPTSGRPLRRP